MKSQFSLPIVNRRQMLKGTAATAALWASRGGAFRAAAANLSATTGNQPYPAGSITQIPMTISNTITGGKVGDGFAGLAYPKELMLGTLFTGWDQSLVKVFKLLGTSLLRVGGSTTDTCIWTPNGPGGQSGKVAPADVENLAAFLNATGWKCIYGINLAGAATGATNTKLAAEEAAFVSKTLGSSLQSFELGNEPDLYGNPGNPFANDDWSLSKFLTLWEEYRSAVVKAAPGVALSGPACAGNPTTWVVPFAQAVGNQKIDMLTDHYYVAAATASDATVEELLNVGLHHDVLRELAALKGGADQIGVPFRMNECGDFFSSNPNPPEPNIEGSYAAALWCLDYMSMCAQGGAQGVNFESGGPSASYVPIINESDYVSGIAPLFYGIKLFTMAGTGTCITSDISAGSMNVTGYALHRTQGGFSVIILNKNYSGNAQMQITFPIDIVSATLTEMTQRSSGATTANVLAQSGVTIQGSGITTGGGFSPAAAYHLTPDGTKVTCYVPPMSAVLIEAND
jgi:hypothetical protein